MKVYSRDEAALNYTHPGQSIIGQSVSVSLSVDGKTLAIGTKNKQAKVYGWDETALDYTQLGQSISGNGLVSLSFDGKILAIGGHGSYYVNVIGGMLMVRSGRHLANLSLVKQTTVFFSVFLSLFLAMARFLPSETH